MALCGGAFSTLRSRASDASIAIEFAHREIWRRFIDQHGIMVDFTDLDGVVNLPSPEECRAGKPNALGWFQPIENGAMFNGLYLDAAINRWRVTRTEEDAGKARRLMEGLILLNSISDVKGFVGRGVSTDGRSHYPMGSNDQTSPWLFGLWLYWKSGIATDSEKRLIEDRLKEVIEVIIQLEWKMPAEEPFGTRGSFGGFGFGDVSRQLFVLKLMHEITKESKWEDAYRNGLHERSSEKNISKLETCESGMHFYYAKTHNWTSCCEVAALRGLWEMEKDESIKGCYYRGLQKSAKLASESLDLAQEYDNQDKSPFSQDWRQAMLPLWKPQKTEQESVALATEQLKEFVKLSPKRNKETAFIREPTSAAWIVTLCPDKELVQVHAHAIETMIAHYDYSKLYYCTFFWVESAWWRLRLAFS